MGPLVRSGPRSLRMTLRLIVSFNVNPAEAENAAGIAKQILRYHPRTYPKERNARGSMSIQQRRECCGKTADSSFTTPEPTPKSGMLFGAPGTFGAPFAQNDTAANCEFQCQSSRGRECCGNSNSRFFVHHPRTYPTELRSLGALVRSGSLSLRMTLASRFSIR